MLREHSRALVWGSKGQGAWDQAVERQCTESLYRGFSLCPPPPLTAPPPASPRGLVEHPEGLGLAFLGSLDLA